MPEITETRKTVTVYKVGGREFSDLAEAEEHQRGLEQFESLTHFEVQHRFDLTEGRGFQHVTHLFALTQEAALQWCITELGDVVGDFYGRPQQMWKLRAGENVAPSDLRLGKEQNAMTSFHRVHIQAIVLDDWGKVRFGAESGGADPAKLVTWFIESEVQH